VSGEASWRRRTGASPFPYSNVKQQLGVIVRLDRTIQYSRGSNDWAETPLEYWIPIPPTPRLRRARKSGHDGGGDVSPHSRGTKCPSDASFASLLDQEGAGNAGCSPHPWPACNKKAGGSHQVRRNSRHSLRNGLTAYTCSPWCTGLFSHHRLCARHAQT
jgi:hypothetical protein